MSRKVIERKVRSSYNSSVSVYICPWCGREIPGSNQTKGICPYCNGKIYYRRKRSTYTGVIRNRW